ncbi:MAG: PAS domain S-box protein [Methanolinea sp.]
MISVLLVDDEPALLDVTQIFLERDGKMKVTLSESGRDALEKLKKGHFDIIVSDYEMPGMNGIELLKEVKARGYEIPFIVFTGRGREHVAIEALNLGASFYLQKGGDPKSQFAELRNMITQAVQRRRAEEELRANQIRLQAVIDLSQMTEKSEDALCTYALEKAIALTGSSLGFLAFVSGDGSLLTMHAWSKSALEVCRVEGRVTEYPLETTGLWGDPVRQKRPVIVNDYAGEVAGKRGTPPGHPPLTRFMGIPVLDGPRVVMVAGVANKQWDYTDADAQQVTLLMASLWQILTRKRSEEALAASERRFRSYFELPLAGIAVASPGLRWTQVNRKFCELSGYTPEELSSLSWEDLTPPGDWPREAAEIARVVSGERQLLALGKRLRRKDGTIAEVEVSAMPVRKADGSVDYFVVLATDVSALKETERELLAANERMSATLEELRVAQDSLAGYCHRLEQEERALRESEEKFRKVVETAPSLLLVLDGEGSVTYASPRALPVTGYTPEEIRDLGLPGIVDGGDLPRVREAIARCAGTGAGMRDLEFRGRRKDGSPWCASAAVEPLGGGPGSAPAVLLQLVDITSRRQAEEALRKSEERLREILGTISDVVFSIDADGRITYVSPAVTRILGYSPADLEGRVFAEVLLPGDAAAALANYAELRSGTVREILKIERMVLHRDGTPRWFLISLWPIVRDGKFAGCAGAATDIHDRKVAEEELREREELLAGIFRVAPIGIGLVKERTFLFANDAVCRMTGYLREELLGKSSRLLYASDGEFERVGREMAGRMWETAGETVEATWVRRDGREITVLISTSPVDPSDPGSPVVFSAMDITAQKERERALLEGGRALREFFDGLRSPAFLVGADGTVAAANGAFHEVFSGGAAGGGGTLLSEIVGEDLAREVMARVREALSEGRARRFEAPRGETRFLFEACLVKDGGAVARAAVIAVDVTDLHRAREALAARAERLSLLSRAAAQDGGRILSALRAYLGRMERETDDPLLRTYVKKQEKYAGALAAVLGYLREYARGAGGPPAWHDVGSLVRKAAAVHDLRDVAIYLDCGGLSVRADPLVERGISALIGHALGKEGVTRISFSYREEGDGIVLTCEDDGAGSPGAAGGEGSDPGLSLAAEILSAEGFRVYETRTEGGGCRVEIAVPPGSFRLGGENRAD